MFKPTLTKQMRILTNLIGIGLLIIMLKFLTPNLYSGFEGTVLAIFNSIKSLITSADSPMTAGFVNGL
jgi:hypothetical protein